MSAPGVIVTVAVVVATAEATSLNKSKSLSMRPVIAGFILGLFLFGVDEVNTKFAQVAMVLIVIGSLIGNGSSLVELLTKAPYAAKA